MSPEKNPLTLPGGGGASQDDTVTNIFRKWKRERQIDRETDKIAWGHQLTYIWVQNNWKINRKKKSYILYTSSSRTNKFSKLRFFLYYKPLKVHIFIIVELRTKILHDVILQYVRLFYLESLKNISCINNMNLSKK